ncbi:MAG: hypothetical protein HY691_07660 [Chloroflexi bacterium]|nr:hypothetical protein [Chloroflexota bacterium]
MPTTTVRANGSGARTPQPRAAGRAAGALAGILRDGRPPAPEHAQSHQQPAGGQHGDGQPPPAEGGDNATDDGQQTFAEVAGEVPEAQRQAAAPRVVGARDEGCRPDVLRAAADAGQRGAERKLRERQRQRQQAIGRRQPERRAADDQPLAEALDQ